MTEIQHTYFEPYDDFVLNESGIDEKIVLASGLSTNIKISLETFERAGLLNEFTKFYRDNQPLGKFEALAKEFAEMHPDMVYVPEKKQ